MAYTAQVSVSNFGDSDYTINVGFNEPQLCSEEAARKLLFDQFLEEMQGAGVKIKYKEKATIVIPGAATYVLQLRVPTPILALTPVVKLRRYHTLLLALFGRLNDLGYELVSHDGTHDFWYFRQQVARATQVPST